MATLVRKTVVVFLMAVIAVGIANGAAQTDPFDPVPFTIHKASCPVDHPGSIYSDCHDNGLAGVPFEIRGFEMATQNVVTDGNGVATAMILDNMSTTSDITVIEDPGSVASHLGAYVFCSDQNSGDVLYDGMASESGAIYFESLFNDQYVICDWYNFTAATTPENGNGQSDSEPATAEGEQVAALPTTGIREARSSRWQSAFIVSLLTGFVAVSIRPRRVSIGLMHR